MNDRLETLLRDPRAHQDTPDADAVRDWSDQALARWQAEQAAEAGRVPRRRFGWTDIATAAGLVSAAVAIAPVVGALAGHAWTALHAGAARLADRGWAADAAWTDGTTWTQALAEAPPALLAVAALAVFLSVPQLRGMASRVLDG